MINGFVALPSSGPEDLSAIEVIFIIIIIIATPNNLPLTEIVQNREHVDTRMHVIWQKASVGQETNAQHVRKRNTIFFWQFIG